MTNQEMPLFGASKGTDKEAAGVQNAGQNSTSNTKGHLTGTKSWPNCIWSLRSRNCSATKDKE